MRWLTKPKLSAVSERSPLAIELDRKPNVMIDLETMGTGPKAAIVSIGACKFDSSAIIETFSVNVDLQTALTYGLEVDAGTIYWWLRQSDEARGSFRQDCQPIDDVLFAFADWIDPGSNVWGNGSDFDNVILANAYRACVLPVPWGNWSSRCYRTIKNTWPKVEMDREGTHHNAKDDAVSQAKHLIRIAEAP